MYKVMCIFGTRPEAIKMAPVIHAIEQHPQLQGIVCSWGCCSACWRHSRSSPIMI